VILSIRVEARWGLPCTGAAAIFFSGPRNGSRAAQIVPESPGTDRPTTGTAAAACEGVIEAPGALAEARVFFAAAPAHGRRQRTLLQKPK
jgi:hypothetical protein